MSFGGLVLILAIAWGLSEDRGKVAPRIALWGLGLQLALALIVLKTAPGRAFFDGVQRVFLGVVASSNQGAAFLFGDLVSNPGYGAIVASQAPPVIIFVSSLPAVLHHLRVIQAIVRAMAHGMQHSIRISNAECLAAALFVFLGIVSAAPIGRCIEKMTRSERFVVMTAFLATIATSVRWPRRWECPSRTPRAWARFLA